MKSPLKNSTRKFSIKGDIFIPISVIILALIGTVFIYSASNYSAEITYGDKCYFVKKQLLGIGLGIITMIFTANVDYSKLKKIWLPVCIVTIVLLCLVFVPGIGVENYGAKRWIGFGSFTIQPSELAKFSLILFSAVRVSKNPEKVTSFIGVLPILIYGVILCVLIMLEPNMSITACVGLLMVSMLFVSGIKIKTLLCICLPALALGVVLILIEPYRLSRLFAFINPWANPKGEGYQLLQSLYA